VRAAKFLPFFDSPIEKAYGAAIQKTAGQRPYRELSDVPPHLRDFFEWDEHEKVVVPKYSWTPNTAVASIPFTPELRMQIRGLATQYLSKQ
jgi:hypothetical protein